MKNVLNLVIINLFSKIGIDQVLFPIKMIGDLLESHNFEKFG